MFNHTSPEFQAFLSNLKKLYSQIKAENPLATSFAGDFNAHSQCWRFDGDTTPEDREIKDLFTSLGLTQIISEPTNFEPNCNLSCIFFMHFCPFLSHAESINSDLQTFTTYTQQ